MPLFSYSHFRFRVAFSKWFGLECCRTCIAENTEGMGTPSQPPKTKLLIISITVKSLGLTVLDMNKVLKGTHIDLMEAVGVGR